MFSVKEYLKTLGGKISIVAVVIIIFGLIYILIQSSSSTGNDRNQEQSYVAVTIQNSSSNSTITDQSSSQTSSTSSSSTVSATSSDSSNQNISVKSVDFDVRKLTLEKGKEYTLTAKITPENATDTTLKWYTTNNYVATVSSGGVINAIAPGQAFIRAVSSDNQRDTCTVTVVATSKKE